MAERELIEKTEDFEDFYTEEQKETVRKLEKWYSKIDVDAYGTFQELLKGELHYDVHTKDAINPLTRQSFPKDMDSEKGTFITYLARLWNKEIGLNDDEWDFITSLNFEIDYDMVYTDRERKQFEMEDKEDIEKYRENRDRTLKVQDEYFSHLAAEFRNPFKRKSKRKEEVRNKVLLEKKILLAFMDAKKKLLLKKTMGLSRTAKVGLTISPTELSDYILDSEYAVLFQGMKRWSVTEQAGTFLAMSREELDGFLGIDNNRIEEFFNTDWGIINKRMFLNLLYTLCNFNFILLIIRYIFSFINIDRVVISNNVVYLTLSTLIPFITWILLSDSKSFAFNHQKKFNFLLLGVGNALLTITQPLYTLFRSWFLWIALLKTGKNFTPAVALIAMRIAIFVPLLVAFVILAKQIFPIITNEEMKEKIIAFKFNQKFDTRKNKVYQFDCNVIVNTDNGKRIIVQEEDLYTHTLLLGASGTGKTSLFIIPQVINNLRTREQNLDYQKIQALKMLKDNKCYITSPFLRNAFAGQYFKVSDDNYESELRKVFSERQTCGITVVAPNADVGNKIIQYCSNRGIWVNNIDPTKKKATYPYERLCGMNAVALPERFFTIQAGDLDAEEERTIRIAETANNLADALTAINELNGGSGDQYFTDVNTTVTSAVAQITMLCASIESRQTDLNEIYLNIQDFGRLKSICEKIEQFFEIEGLKGNEVKAVGLRNIAQENEDFEKQSMIDDAKEEEIYNALTDTDRDNPYIRTLITVKNRLVPKGQMDQHAEGLRNLFGKILQDPQVERVLVKNKDYINFDEMLAHGEITVINTALEVGKNSSTCFGQLFLLNYNSAVLRRPMENRTPNFLYIDETARYLSDTLDTMCTLYRQYRVSVTFCMQNLQQFERVKSLAYLKSVLLSCGTLIVFGRTSYEDSELFSKLGGQMRYDMPQVTTAEGSFFAADPHTSHSVRTTPNIKNVAESHDIRYRDFQDLTILASENGRPIPARYGRSDFAPKELFTKQVRHHIERNDSWVEVFKAYYPKVEDIMPVEKDTVISQAPGTVYDTHTTVITESEPLHMQDKELPRDVEIIKTFDFGDDDDDEEFISYLAADKEEYLFADQNGRVSKGVEPIEKIADSDTEIVSEEKTPISKPSDEEVVEEDGYETITMKSSAFKFKSFEEPTTKPDEAEVVEEEKKPADESRIYDGGQKNLVFVDEEDNDDTAEWLFSQYHKDGGEE